MSKSANQLKRRLEEARHIDDTLERRLWIVGVITQATADLGVRPVLVGGAAVEFYTLGGYATQDVDIVMPSSPQIDDAMSGLGFEKSGRYWVRADLDVMLEAPPPPLAGDPDRVVEIQVESWKVYVIGIEDLVIDRLNAQVHWQSDEDRRWAERLVAGAPDTIDWPYLERRARDEGVEEPLAELRSRVVGE